MLTITVMANIRWQEVLNDHIYHPSAVIHRYAYMLWFSTTRMNTLTIIVMATVRMQAALNDHILSFSPPHG